MSVTEQVIDIVTAATSLWSKGSPTVQPESRLDTLGLDSLDTLSVACEIEDAFEIPPISRATWSDWATIADIVAHVDSVQCKA